MATPEISVRQLFDRESCTYTYLLVDPQTGEGAIIDGVLETFERDLQIINELGIELLYAIETHAHADHITSAGKMRELTGAKLVYGEGSGIEAIDIPLKDGESITLCTTRSARSPHPVIPTAVPVIFARACFSAATRC